MSKTAKKVDGASSKLTRHDVAILSVRLFAVKTEEHTWRELINFAKEVTGKTIRQTRTIRNILESLGKPLPKRTKEDKRENGRNGQSGVRFQVLCKCVRSLYEAIGADVPGELIALQHHKSTKEVMSKSGQESKSNESNE